MARRKTNAASGAENDMRLLVWLRHIFRALAMHQSCEGDDDMRVHLRDEDDMGMQPWSKKTPQGAAVSGHQKWRFKRVAEGWDARMDGRSRSVCPYKKGDFQQLWCRGWDEAERVLAEREVEDAKLRELERSLGKRL